jgi:hypothetical protein
LADGFGAGLDGWHGWRCGGGCLFAGVMTDLTSKVDQERQGWTRPSDIVWAAGYLIGTILRALLL